MKMNWILLLVGLSACAANPAPPSPAVSPVPPCVCNCPVCPVATVPALPPKEKAHVRKELKAIQNQLRKSDE